MNIVISNNTTGGSSNPLKKSEDVDAATMSASFTYNADLSTTDFGGQEDRMMLLFNHHHHSRKESAPLTTATACSDIVVEEEEEEQGDASSSSSESSVQQHVYDEESMVNGNDDKEVPRDQHQQPKGSDYCVDHHDTLSTTAAAVSVNKGNNDNNASINNNDNNNDNENDDFMIRCFVDRMRTSGMTVVKHCRSRWCKSRLRHLKLIVAPTGSSKNNNGKSGGGGSSVAFEAPTTLRDHNYYLTWEAAEWEPASSKRPPRLDLRSCLAVRHATAVDPESSSVDKHHSSEQGAPQLLQGTDILRKKCQDNVRHKSFSLVFKKRTVDITAVTADQCTILMRGFAALCDRLKKQKQKEREEREREEQVQQQQEKQKQKQQDQAEQTLLRTEHSTSCSFSAGHWKVAESTSTYDRSEDDSFFQEAMITAAPALLSVGDNIDL